jgi:hypothetical protein
MIPAAGTGPCHTLLKFKQLVDLPHVETARLLSACHKAARIVSRPRTNGPMDPCKPIHHITYRERVALSVNGSDASDLYMGRSLRVEGLADTRDRSPR